MLGFSCLTQCPSQTCQVAATRDTLAAAARLQAELYAARGCIESHTDIGSHSGATTAAFITTPGAATRVTAASSASAYRGSARITELNAATSPEAVQAFLQVHRTLMHFVSPKPAT